MKIFADIKRYYHKHFKRWPLVIISLLILMSFIGFWIIYKIAIHVSLLRLPRDVYVAWNIDSDTENEIKDSTGEYNAAVFNVELAEGYSGKAGYFNGKNSYIETFLNFQGWKGVTISLWVKPDDIERNGLSVILDNGHTASRDFAIQSAAFSGEKWVWHCNGRDIFFTLPLQQWTHIVVTANSEEGIIQVYINGIIVGAGYTDPFEFGTTPLIIGRLATANSRYFKGSIDEIQIWKRAISES